MRNRIIIGILLLVILAVVFLRTSKHVEGFTAKEDTIMDKVQDRANPLAAQQNPVTNPAAELGISQSSGSSLRTMSQAALNIPMQVPNGDGTYTTQPAINTISPRIDNESSFLAMVKFCKDTSVSAVKSGTSPFANPKFAANCGMCMSPGKLVTGESFTKPTGIVVFSEDKQIGLTHQKDNKYRYPRVIPSLNSATCEGAVLDDDSKPPVLAINDAMYQDILKRNACKVQQWYGSSCGQCLSDSTSWSYVKTSSGEIYETIFWLYGNGNVQVFVGGSPVGGLQTLKPSTATVVRLGVVTEGTTFQIKVTVIPPPLPPLLPNGSPGPLHPPSQASMQLVLFGALQSTLPNGKPFYMPIDNLLEIDEVSGATPRRLSSQVFSDIGLTLMSFVPTSPAVVTNEKPPLPQMILDGSFPLTFINPDQIAYYDCGAGPYTTIQNDGSLLTNNSDPCLNPASQGPDTYAGNCLQSRIISAGCSTEGKWYLKGLPGTVTSGKSLSDIDNWLNNNVQNSNNDPAIALGCYGTVITGSRPSSSGPSESGQGLPGTSPIPSGYSSAYALVEVRSKYNSTWNTEYWEYAAPPMGNGVMWIWATKGANFDAPTGTHYTFTYIYNNTQILKNATIAVGIDQDGTVKFNENTIFSGTGSSGPLSVTLQQGENTITIQAINHTGPAGLWATLTDPLTGTLLCKTDAEWIWK